MGCGCVVCMLVKTGVLRARVSKSCGDVWQKLNSKERWDLRDYNQVDYSLVPGLHGLT